MIHASQYSRRVCESLAEYPFRILLLIKSPQHVQCDLRRTIAEEILSGQSCDLHIVPRKIRRLFRDDLEFAARHGQLGPRLAVNLQQVGRTWKADTRENERAA